MIIRSISQRRSMSSDQSSGRAVSVELVRCDDVARNRTLSAPRLRVGPEADGPLRGDEAEVDWVGA
ncbi:hypothetical protein N865_13895 [Intrasporangium oryzae NRRL B-24470]|uniref:Uncharacterized protein n=1 Tax=Intrasporangium oryzae NRRL B-24470 TaxID=1386089 RepID=W9G410_9MICO|nr:hypothetical protein [Intrasporangium oryzae]EWT00760.1 hypothetical protein N865_13895 [Intrasporangium oryzae NRRL B-24470]